MIAEADLTIPTDYLEGFDKALAINPDLAHNYIRHANLMDTECDAVVEDLIRLGLQHKNHQILSFVLNPNSSHKDDAANDVPPLLREFIESVKTSSSLDWVSEENFLPGRKMFYRNSEYLLATTLVASLIEGFSTNMSRAFFLTGRWRDQGVRRLKQNIRFTVELFLPKSLEPFGEGWQLALRTRIIHSRMRKLIAQSGEWDHEAWGPPIHASHMALASTAFSLRTVIHSKKLGARYTNDELESYIQLWRYAGYLLGVPETILFTNAKEAEQFFDIGATCEPPPSWESIASANSVIHSTPLLFGITERSERLMYAEFIYSLSRAIIGNEFSDLLKYPKTSGRGLIAKAKIHNMFTRIVQTIYPKYKPESKLINFLDILPIISIDEDGISYKLPDKVYSEETCDW